VIGRLRREEAGIGLVELVFAMAIMNIVILALFGAFNAGGLAIQRAARVSTAETLADKQLELYRAQVYGTIGLEAGLISTAGSDSTHTGDAAWGSAASQLSYASCTTSVPECKPVQTSVSGPDGRLYRIDTFIRQLTSGGGWPTNGRAVKRVTVVVRRQGLTPVLARLSSTFDRSTGCISPNPC
jgi:type II secretory pathway pseudopilin PulG